MHENEGSNTPPPSQVRSPSLCRARGGMEAIAITPPTLIRFTPHDLCVLLFVVIEVEEQNGSNEDDLNMDIYRYTRSL